MARDVRSAGPLDGILVADFSRVLAGPLTTMILGDMGADVIKVERPETGDATRAWGPPWHGDTSSYYKGLNRNKRSITLDLTDAGDLAVARRLAIRADVLVENFRPGRMRRWGLSYEDLAPESPRLVFCTISGFGSQGPGADLPGYDLLVQAMSGLMSITGLDGRPTKVGVALIDKICGLYAVAGILAGLVATASSGRGQHVEVALFDAALVALLNEGSAYLLAGAEATPRGNRHPSIAPYQTYRAADRSFILAVGTDEQWRKACMLIDRRDLAEDPELATNSQRVAHIDLVERELERTFEKRDAAEWIAMFREEAIPSGPVNTIAEAFAFAADIGRPAIVSMPDQDGIFQSTRSPIQMSATPVEVKRTPPRLGEHMDEIRAWLLSDEAG